VHAGKYGHADVDVVMNLDAHLAVDRPEHASDVLDQATTERDRERKKQSVERRAVEALAEKAAGREQDDTIPGSSRRKAVGNQASRFLANAALKYIDRQTALLKRGLEPCDVLGPLRQDQSISAIPRSRGYVRTNQPRPALVLDETSKDRLDRHSGG
jgi:hypothetical protein